MSNDDRAFGLPAAAFAAFECSPMAPWWPATTTSEAPIHGVRPLHEPPDGSRVATSSRSGSRPIYSRLPLPGPVRSATTGAFHGHESNATFSIDPKTAAHWPLSLPTTLQGYVALGVHRRLPALT